MDETYGTAQTVDRDLGNYTDGRRDFAREELTALVRLAKPWLTKDELLEIVEVTYDLS